MNDPRSIPFNGRVAHISLKGRVPAETFTEGEQSSVGVPLTPILRQPGGPRERELLFGETFRVLAIVGGPEAECAYGFAERDGYCGHVEARALTPAPAATHRVAVRETHAKATPDLKVCEPLTPLYFGARLTVTGRAGDWARFACPGGSHAFVPAAHIVPIATFETEPVAVARRFLGTPYVWGGNSGRGIDCSGLIQAAMLACGRACPGDSDLQEAMPGTKLPRDAPLRPGDLIFWKGHVAMATGSETIIHANAHHMMVAEEELAPAITRIAATDTGPETLRLRPEPRPVRPPYA